MKWLLSRLLFRPYTISTFSTKKCYGLTHSTHWHNQSLTSSKPSHAQMRKSGIVRSFRHFSHSAPARKTLKMALVSGELPNWEMETVLTLSERPKAKSKNPDHGLGKLRWRSWVTFSKNPKRNSLLAPLLEGYKRRGGGEWVGMGSDKWAVVSGQWLVGSGW